jgi:molybdopterin molybdotransferase
MLPMISAGGRKITVTEVADFPIGISVDEARRRIIEVCTSCALGVEEVALESALRRVLAVDVSAPFDVPGFVNSAMDGFAVRAIDLPADDEKDFQLGGEIFAGGTSTPQVGAGICVRITTGAPLPPGADTVVMKENTRSDGNRVTIQAGTHAGANVRPAGEDYRRGDVALRRGTVLMPAQLGVLASFGSASASVSRRPRAVLLTTGDELVAPGAPLGFGQIHDSNRYSLGALLDQYGTTLLRHERVRDDPQLLRAALLRAGADADIVVSSGGVSAGEADYLPKLIAEVGKVHFWKVRIKPGMPFLFGQVGAAQMFALPGNPVSGIAIFLTLLRPAIAALSGTSGQAMSLRACLTQAIDKRHARTEFQRAHLACDAQGRLQVSVFRKQGSGMLRGVAEGNALAVLPEGIREFKAGEVVDVLPLPGFSPGGL